MYPRAAGDYQYGLRGDVRDALPALSGLRRLSMHSAYHCPQGLAQLQHLEDLSVTVRSGGGDSLGAWDLRGLRGLRRAVFQGRSFGGLTHLPRMDASLAALERLCLVDVQVGGGAGGGCEREGQFTSSAEKKQEMGRRK